MLSFGPCGSLAFGLCLHGRSFRWFVRQSVTVRRIAVAPHSTSILSAAAMRRHPVDALPVARLWSCVSTARAGLGTRSAQSAAPRRANKAGFGASKVKKAVSAVRANAEQRAANLRSIVDDLRPQGFTTVRTIASQLNSGILTPRGGAWHPTSAARLLTRLQTRRHPHLNTRDRTMSALPPKVDIRN